MKYVACILDGASDEGIPLLQGKTPLAAAHSPHLDFLAQNGCSGRMQTAFSGVPTESLACIMGIFGYSPVDYYPQGRAAVEALALGIPVFEGDIALRCNIVEISSDGRLLESATPAHIDDAKAKAILSRAELPSPSWELHSGRSYRNVLVIRDIRDALPGIASALHCFPPHMHIGDAIADLYPVATAPDAALLARQLADCMAKSAATPSATTEHGAEKRTMLWVWSPSVPLGIPSFFEQYKRSGAVVTGTDVVRGLGLAAGMECKEVPGATGYTDTDYRAKTAATIEALDRHDFVCVHVNSPDEAAHQRSPEDKIRAIEHADKQVIGPLLHYLRERHAGDFRLAVCIDHGTRCKDGKHIDEPTPYAMYSDAGLPLSPLPAGGAFASPAKNFSEETVSGMPPLSSLHFLKMLFAE